MIFFFYGPNTFAAREQIAKMVGEYEKKSGSNYGLERIDGSRARLADIVAALQAAPFLANSRLVIIENLGQNKSAAPKISDLTKSVPATTVAVFYDPQVDQRTNYYKHLKATKAVKFEPLTYSQLQSWIAAEAKKQDAEVDGQAIVRLLELAGEDQWRLQGEIAKLANFNPQITVESVETLVVPSHSESIFDLVEAMSSGRQKKAIELHQGLRQQQINEVYILSMIIWQLRNLLLAKTAGNITPAELAKKAGMSPFVAAKMQSKQRHISQETLKWAFLEAVETDYRIKTGQGAADALVEQLILRVAGDIKTGA